MSATTHYPKNQQVIDLSHWNTIENWQSVVDDDVVGVVHKYSQGASYHDPTYSTREAGALAVGLLFGRYHFGDGTDVQTQVTSFLTGWQEHELLALDWETNTSGSTMTLAQAEEFVLEVEKRTGVVPVLYSGDVLKGWMKQKPSPVLKNCRLWLAHYADQPRVPDGWDVPWLWQWTDKGVVKGIKGDCDVDSFDGHGYVLLDTWAPELLS
jgi:lysozyme